MDLKEFFPDVELEKAQRVIIPFHDKLLLDDKISHSQAIPLCVYMVCNSNKCAEVDKKTARDLFAKMGRATSDFDKAFYEISGKRKNTASLVKVAKDKISLTHAGYKAAKQTLEDNHDS